ncbi:ATP-binding protein [Polaromonas sp. YR568]|uniref:ATP-binding protein n=1 Tax=Polaromonas sp. YR568 TaxID=1855301 RepID=UPI00398BC12D
MGEMALRHPRSFVFGPFLLIPERQLLMRGDAQVRIGGRALDILTALVERPGQLVGKRELVARVWPNTVVEDANLKVNMVALRRALGDEPGAVQYIATVVGRGYRFVAPVQALESAGFSIQGGTASTQLHNLPSGTTRIVGRSDAINAIRQDLKEARLVSIVGPGGVGKTTVALAVAERAVGSFRDGVWLVDLALLKDPDLVPNAIATTIGVVAHLPNMLGELSEFLRKREMLLILDSSEHVIDVTAACVSVFLAEAAGVKILVTSREPLLVYGERVRRLPGLGTPPPAAHLNAEETLAFPAIELFVDRATDRNESFKLSDADAPAVAEICRRLDGLALAIALAATRLEAFGVSGLLKQLDDRFRLLIGRRAGPERHRTLAATLDWSYGLLSPEEAALMRAVAVFAGAFDVDGASAVAGVASPDAGDILVQLAEKSLLAADLDADSVAYRLPDTTRAYCLERLQAGGADQAVRRRHAEHVCTVLEQAASEWAQRPAREWGNAYGRLLDDLRGALTYAGRDAADGPLRIRLTVAGILLWNHFALTAECRAHVSQAIAGLDAAGLAGTAFEMRLQLWLGDATTFTRGPLVEAMDALRKALDIAARIGDADSHIRCLRLIGVHELFRGENDAAIRTLEAFVATAAARVPSAVVEAETALGIGELLVGRLQSARRRLERHHELELHAANDFQSVQYHLKNLSDRINDAGNVLSHVLWLTGSPDASLRTTEATIKHALDARHHVSLTNALSWGCPVAYWTGRYEACTRYAAMLDEEARRHGFAVRRPVALFYRAAIGCAQEKFPALWVDELQRNIEAFHTTGHLVRMPFYLGVLAESLVKCGRLGDAETTIHAALERAAAKNEQWCIPELLRIQASVLAAQGQAGKAESRLLDALARAREIDALSWSLRAASDLAQLWRAQSRERDALEILQPVYSQFTEGFETRDLAVAAGLMASLQGQAGA